MQKRTALLPVLPWLLLACNALEAAPPVVPPDQPTPVAATPTPATTLAAPS